MGLPVTVYRWDDVGAPVFNPIPSGFIALLKACLVDGYGTKSPLGWSMPFADSGTSKAVFRNSSVDGSGGFVQIESETGADGINTEMTIASAASMSGLGIYINKSFIRTVRLYPYDTQWVLIGTSRGFYFQLLDNRYTATNNRIGSFSQMMFIGDIHSYFEPDAGTFTVSYGGSTTVDDVSASASDSLVNLSGASNILNKLYDVDGANSSLLYTIDTFGSPTNRGNGSPESRGANLFLYELQICASVSSSVLDRNGIALADSPTRPYNRGKLAGFLLASTTGYYDEPWGVVRNVNGVNHFGFSYNDGISCWVNMESWYD